MVTVRVVRDRQGAVTGLTARGHAGFAPAGEDIVCASVSALLQTAVLGLQERLMVPVDVHSQKGNLSLKLTVPGLPQATLDAAAVLLDSILLGIAQIASQNPHCVRLSDPGRSSNTRGE